MDRLAQEVDAARHALSPRWDPERSERLYAGLLRRRRRRRATRMAAASALLGTLAVVLIEQPSAPQAPAPQAQAASSAASEVVEGTVRSAHRLRMADGSLAQLIGAESELEIKRNEAGAVALALHAGRAHFEIVPDGDRTFEVEAGPYRVVVVGTVFDVARQPGQVEVAVARGRVRVHGPHGAQDLVAGQRKRFSVDDVPAPQVDAEANPEASEAEAEDEPDAPREAHDEPEVRREPRDKPLRARGRRREVQQPSWRSLSQSGDYDAAYEHLRRGGAVDDDPGALMDAADAARLSGHPASATNYLERVVRDHRDSPVAPLSAFTLGRVYLDQLGQPHRAAEAFRIARALAPQGSLAQDALAREVEALSKGGNAQEANLRAREYLRRYPDGRRMRAVQRYGGLTQ